MNTGDLLAGNRWEYPPTGRLPDRSNPPIFQPEQLPAPDYRISGKAPRPEPQPKKVPQRQQPQIPQHLPIAQHPNPNRQRHRHPRQRHHTQQRKTPQRKPARHTSHHRPRQRIRNHQPHISPLARIPRRPRPPQLVIPKPAKPVSRHGSLHHLTATAPPDTQPSQIRAPIS